MRVLACLVLLSACAQAPAGVPPASSATISAEIQQLEHQLAAAVVARDYTTIRRIEAPSYVYTDADANVSTRDEFIRDYQAGTSTVRQLQFSDMTVDAYDRTTIVRGILTVEREDAGVRTARRARYTRAYIHCETGWCAVAGHSSALPGQTE